MGTKFFILAILFTTFCFAQTPSDSTSIKNQQLIEQLKNRINTIDNIGNGTNVFQKQIDEMKIEMARQNDSIVKLLNIISSLKQYASNNINNQSKNTAAGLILDSENEIVSTSKKMSDKQYNEFSKSESYYQDHLNSCNCAAIFYKPYQIELNFKTIIELDAVIKKYEATSNKQITIIGHADKSGDESININLSKQRAENLKKYLIIASDKIKKENIVIEWHGSSKPIQNLPEDKEQLNRRTEITLQ